MNEFGRIQLEKYGWKKGAGLGKQEDGIKEAIKPSLKFDKSGIGHDASEQFTFRWWDHAFNKAASNIEVINGDDKVEVRRKTESTFEISTKKSHVSTNIKNKRAYGSFVKTGTMTGSGEMVSCESSNEATSSNGDNNLGNNDEEIFKKCSGRTGHRAARHGLKMNGKLMRIMKQEKEALCAKVSNSFHKKEVENEKHGKNTESILLKKKHKSKQEAACSSTKRSLASAVNDSSSKFMNSAVGQFVGMASKIKKKKK